MDVLIVGCGYLGSRVAAHYVERQRRVRCLVRTSSSAQRLAAMGIDAIALDLDSEHTGSLPFQMRGGGLFYFVPPPGEGDADPRVRRLIEGCACSGQPRRVVYVSTTGVYGDCAGRWIDERSPVHPGAPRARRRLDAEAAWREWKRDSNGELVILRVPGIYGPGRLPLQRLRDRVPVVRESESPWSNRIHVDDLVRVCAAAMENGRDGEIYNASDGNPTTMTDFFNRVADAYGLPRPPTISMAEAGTRLSPAMLSYLRESRRLSNLRVRQELGVDLLYPDLSSGLAACLESDG
jgi:nucleoside-diphosphate-sugar epimerase